MIWFGVEVHAVGLVEFFAALHQDVAGLFGLGIGLGDDVVDLFEHGAGGAESLKLAEVGGAAGEQHGLVGSVELDGRSGDGVADEQEAAMITTSPATDQMI